MMELEFLEYDKLVARIYELYANYYQAYNKMPNKVFMMRYHLEVLKTGPQISNENIEPNRILDMEIEIISTAGDIIYVGYVEQG